MPLMSIVEPVWYNDDLLFMDFFMPLTIDQKQRLFLILKEKQTEDFAFYLIKAIQNGLVLSVIGNLSPLKELTEAYNACKSIPKLEDLQLSVIREYIYQEGANQFKEAFNRPFEENDWSSSDFLQFMAGCFKIEIDSKPVVKLSISDGKVYWRIIKDEAILYDSTHKTRRSPLFCFDDAAKITMTWSQFRRFKDAGKRGSSVAVTQDRFFHECSKDIANMSRPVSDLVWQELRDKGILDKNDRLSHFWISHSGSVTLNSLQTNSHIEYKQISEVLNRISQDPQYATYITDQCVIYRPSRSLKLWQGTGRLINFNPRINGSEVRIWDVSNNGDLMAHDVTEDGLDHDHIPSTVQMSEYQNEERKAFRITEEDKKSSSQWGCIELSHSLHAGGVTYKMNKKDQLKMTNPFYEEVGDYLSKLDNKKTDEYIESLGAFRYLYRCQIKQKFSSTSSGFFHKKQDLKQNIDQLFMRELEKAMAFS